MATASVLEAPNLVRRLTATLLAGQSMASLAATGAITVGSIAATQLTGSAALAGLPTTMMVLGTALGAYPAGRLMDRYGRRFGLTLGFLIGVIGSLAGVYALIGFVPALLFLGHAVMGMARGALDQGRFAAAEIVTPEHRARAVSYVVLGGTVGGIGGPLFIGPTSRLSAQLGFDLLVGPYFAGLLLFALGVILMFAFLRPDPRDLGRHLARIRLTNAVIDNTPPRTFREALHSRNIQTAVAAMVLGQVVMVTVMVMTPLHMTEHLGHTL
ncbi:MAG TPA: MFS transporter, partial [Anaerolineae bacterium]|nr:MFS transporter [Anaerolineae bacterium]